MKRINLDGFFIVQNCFIGLVKVIMTVADLNEGMEMMGRNFYRLVKDIHGLLIFPVIHLLTCLPVEVLTLPGVYPPD